MSEDSTEKRRISLRRVISALSTALAVMSLVLLCKREFQVGLAPVLEELFSWYDDKVRLALSWMEPYLNAAIALLPWHPPKLDPIWRHILILGSACFGPMANKELWRQSKFEAGFVALTPVVMSLLLGLFAGSGIATGSDMLGVALVIFPIVTALALAAGTLGTLWEARQAGSTFKTAWGNSEAGRAGRAGLATLKILAGAAFVIVANAGMK